MPSYIVSFLKASKMYLFFGLGTVVFFFLRIIYIQSIPAVISHDEIYYAAEARSIAVSGTDPTGTWSPWSLTSAHPLYAELPGLIMTPAALVFSDPLVAAHITHVLLGTAFCLVLAAFAYRLSGSVTMAMFAFVLAGVNPWLFQFSRMGFDALFSLFFYFTGLTIYLSTSGYKKLWSLPLLFVGFFQYQGLKVIFVPLVLATCLYDSFRKEPLQPNTQTKHSWKALLTQHMPAVLTIIFVFVVFGTYLLRLSSQAAGERTNDLIFSDTTYTAAMTNTNRQQTLGTPLAPFFINKATTVFDRFLSQYFQSFSWHHLFLTGEPLRNPFSVWKHGMFYPVDIVFIGLGIFALLRTKKYSKTGLYLLFLTGIAPLAGALSAQGTWTMFRSSLLIPVGIIVAAYGLDWLYSQKKTVWLLLLGVVYAVFITRFFFLYFLSYPIIGTEGEYFSGRVIASYIVRNPEKTIIVYSGESRFMFESILVFTNSISKATSSAIATAYQTKEYRLANFVVKNECYQKPTDPDTVAIVHRATQPCTQEDSAGETTEEVKPTIAISSLIDSGAIYTLHNDTLCSVYGLDRFSHVTRNIFHIESLSSSDFCSELFIRN